MEQTSSFGMGMRWIAVLPFAASAVLVCDLLGMTILVLVSRVVGYNPEWGLYVIHSVLGFIDGFIFVLAGSFAAPRYQQRVGWSLVGTMLFFAGIIVVTASAAEHWHQLTRIIFMLLAGVWAASSQKAEPRAVPPFIHSRS